MLGSIGNILSFLVMMKKSNRSLSCSWYMSVLAVTDTILLMTYCSALIGSQIGLVNQMACSICGIIFNFSSNVTILFITCVTFNRFLAICWPLKFQMWRSPKYSKRVITALLLFTFVCNVPHLFTTKFVLPRIVLRSVLCFVRYCQHLYQCLLLPTHVCVFHCPLHFCLHPEHHHHQGHEEEN